MCSSDLACVGDRIAEHGHPLRLQERVGGHDFVGRSVDQTEADEQDSEVGRTQEHDHGSFVEGEASAAGAGSVAGSVAPAGKGSASSESTSS